MKQDRGSVYPGNQGIGSVDTDLGAGVDTVLSFPQFDHPGAAFVIKINRFTVEYHVESGSALIISFAITKFPLPGIHMRGEDILGQKVFEAKWPYQLIKPA
jgi:hypothetical protein